MWLLVNTTQVSTTVDWLCALIAIFLVGESRNVQYYCRRGKGSQNGRNGMGNSSSGIGVRTQREVCGLRVAVRSAWGGNMSRTSGSIVAVPLYMIRAEQTAGVG